MRHIELETYQSFVQELKVLGVLQSCVTYILLPSSLRVVLCNNFLGAVRKNLFSLHEKVM